MPAPIHGAPVALTAAGVLVGAGLVADAGVPEWEARAFRAVNGLPAWLEPVLWPPMQVGSLWGPVGAGFITWRRTRSWRPTVGVVVAGVAAWQLAKVVKSFVRRGRPADELGEIERRVGTPSEGLGFVSGHTTVAFAMVTVLWPYASWPERLVLLGLAKVVALARIHVAAHLPIDTVGGAALGVLVGEAWTMAVGVGLDERPEGE